MVPTNNLIHPQIAEITRLRNRLAYAHNTRDRLLETLAKFKTEHFEDGIKLSNLLIQINQLHVDADTALTNKRTREYSSKIHMIEDMNWLRDRCRVERIELGEKIEAVDRKIRGWEREICEVARLISVVRSMGGLG